MRFVSHWNRLCCLLFATVLAACDDGLPKLSNADQLYFDALAADADSQTDLAVELLDQAIAIQSSHYMYVKRAELHLKLGSDLAARQDLEAAQVGGAGEVDIQWLKVESGKPAAQRFQGPFATPPSTNK